MNLHSTNPTSVCRFAGIVFSMLLAGASFEPAPALAQNRALQIAAGGAHTCALVALTFTFGTDPTAACGGG